MQPCPDTIAAIATAPGEAGIAIVRVSGPLSFAIADKVFRSPGPPPSRRPPRTFVRGTVCAPSPDGDTTAVDEVILLLYRAPHSYTREDVVEFQGHGGRTAAARILRRLLDAGAAPAPPGEFTRRAFLNGRIDLLQAEAVLDLIRARSDRAAAAAMDQLSGALSHSLHTTYDTILSAAADLEATLDFPDEDTPVPPIADIAAVVSRAAAACRSILDTSDEGHILREGALVVISGPPNVGKSTLLNRLLGSDRAIVSQTPGTTRDTIEEQIVLAGLPIRLVDTAGLRPTRSPVEGEGVARARSLIARADVELHLIDAALPLAPDQNKLLTTASAAHRILVLNKTDLPQRLDPSRLPPGPTVRCSARTGAGIPDLHSAIIATLDIVTERPPHAVISERHQTHIHSALTVLNDSLQLLQRRGEDYHAIAASRLRAALTHIAAVTGRTYNDDILDTVFERFCVGK